MEHNNRIADMSRDYVRQVTQAQETFQANSAARGSVGRHISDLSEQLKMIEASLKSVQGISRQVTILATNASIEAARAGVAGKGFAVVAQEVGSLAKSTDTAVVNIEENLSEMKKMLQSTITNMDNAKAIGAEFDTALADCVEQARQLNSAIEQAPQE